MPATADENMVPPQYCGAAGRLPKFVSNLPLQLPPVGVFSVHDLKWCNVTDNKACSLTAAVPAYRLQDFVQGEETRGRCTLNLWTLRAEGQGVLLNKRAECLYAAPKQGHQKKRKLLLPSEKVLPTEGGREIRLGSLQKGTSVKKDCISLHCKGIQQATWTCHHQVPMLATGHHTELLQHAALHSCRHACA
jgi:hypothetical protein